MARPPRLIAAIALGLAAAAPPAAAAPDSLRWRFEVGGSTDVTNEQFYEDDAADTLFRPRRLVGTPETQVAGVLLAVLAGTRSGGGVDYRLQSHLSLGDRRQLGSLALSWRQDLSPEWRYALLPSLEVRRDRTFGRDLREWRGSAAARLRRSLGGGTAFAEVGAHGEWLESSGLGSDLLLDRRVAQVSAALDRLPLSGAEWHGGYRLSRRVFPDSVTRDHWEHGAEGRWRLPFGLGHAVSAEVSGERRLARPEAPSSRDAFWSGSAALEADLRFGAALAWRSRVSLEGMQYDVEDDLLYFDYRILEARSGPRVERGAVSMSLEPRAGALSAPRNPAEEYVEVGGVAEVEVLAGGAWWIVTPGGGWRDYGEEPAADSGPALHSSFAWYELGLTADQPVPGGVRLRVLAHGRLEAHVDPAHDARSLFLSIDVRRLF